MGCLFKCLDPGPPDDSVRHFWHVRGLILDAATSGQPSTSSSSHQHSPSADTLQVQEGAGGGGGTGRGGGTTANSSNGRQKGGRGANKEKDAHQLTPRQNVQRLPPGVLYIYEGRLVYRSRRWARCPWPSGGAWAEELSIELCQIGDVNVAQQFVSQKDNKPVRCQGPLVDVLVTGRQPPLHLAFLTAQAESVGEELRDIFLRHRHRPRIFQFNSIDVDGIEIDVP